MKSTFCAWSSISIARPETLASPSLTSLSALAAWSEKRGSRRRSFALRAASIIPSHMFPSRTAISMRLIRGEPSARSVARNPIPTASKRARARPATSGAAASISSQLAIGAPLLVVCPGSLPAPRGDHSRPSRHDVTVPRLDPPECRHRFGGAAAVTLATANVDGGADLVPITFALVGDQLVSAVDHKPKSTRRLRRLDNIARQPMVDLLADHYDDDWSTLWWVRAQGSALVVESAPPEMAAALVAKYEPYRE